MAWTKHFRKVKIPAPPGGMSMPELPSTAQDGGAGTASKYASYLPEVYAGHPNRIQRYFQYDDMARDSDISVALDLIADFCTQSEEQSDDPFTIEYVSDASESEVSLLKTLLEKWVRLNDFRSRLWFMFRDTIKYGDTFFLRDPETSEWLWLDAFSVQGVKVDDEHGKVPEEYIVKGFDYNKQAKYASKTYDPSQYNSLSGTQAGYSNRGLSSSSSSGNFALVGQHLDGRASRSQSQATQDLHVLDAEHVIHLSLSAGMDPNWPFGASILDPIFKTFKQKELLEDAIIIYRVQRAPERRIFYIDTGGMNRDRAASHLLAVKNEIHQRRIPSKSGGGSSMLDAAYNPLSMMDDYFFAQGENSRGSRVETLPGGDSLGEIGDVDYFNRKLARGLHIPPSYLAIGEEGNAPYNDGKLGQAMIQEFRFNKYCIRLQNLLAPEFDADFKRFVDNNGGNVDFSIFQLKFNPPQSFSKYRQMEIDAQQIGVYAQIADNKKISERAKFMWYLNWSEERLLENEKWWRQENASKMKATTGGDESDDQSAMGLSSVGIRGGGDFGMGPDLGDDLGDDADGMDGGDPAAAGGAPAAPGAPVAPPPGGDAGAAPGGL